jgi:hypothetical protein
VNGVQRLKRTVGPQEKKTACAVYVIAILVYAKHHDRTLAVRDPVLTLSDIGSDFLVVVEIDRDLTVIKTFGQRCPPVTVNNRPNVSNYIVRLDYESGKGVFAHKDKSAVFG